MPEIIKRDFQEAASHLLRLLCQSDGVWQRMSEGFGGTAYGFNVSAVADNPENWEPLLQSFRRQGLHYRAGYMPAAVRADEDPKMPLGIILAHPIITNSVRDVAFLETLRTVFGQMPNYMMTYKVLPATPPLVVLTPLQLH